MEHKEALLDSLAELRTAHDKASRIMADIAALGARAMKGGDSLPSPGQLHRYAQALAQAQRHASRCQELLAGGHVAVMAGEVAGVRPALH